MPGRVLVNPGDVGLALDTHDAPLAFLLPSGFSGLSARPWQAPKFSVRRCVPGAVQRVTLLRRTGTHANEDVDPGSAHHAARAARCPASGERQRNHSAAICRGAGGGLARSAASCAYRALASLTDFSFTGPRPRGRSARGRILLR